MDIPDKVLDLEGMLVTKQSRRKQVRRILDGMPKRDRDLLRAIFLEDKERKTPSARIWALTANTSACSSTAPRISSRPSMRKAR